MHNPRHPVNDFISFAQQHGYELTDVKADGKIHRFQHGNRKNGWYVVHLNYSERLDKEFIVAEIGDWKSGHKYKYLDKNAVSDDERATRRDEIRQRVEEKDREKLAGYARVADECELEWMNTGEAGLHQYLLRKQIHGHCDSRTNVNNELMIPCTQAGRIWGFQYIKESGEKLFKTGQKFKGTYYIIGKVATSCPMFMCEGFATAVSIHAATQCPVIIAFSAGNLLPVAQQFEGYDITIAADDDQFTDGNPGVTAASNVAKQFGFKCIAPKFKNLDSKPTDFNDLHVLEGLDAVTEQLMNNVVSMQSKLDDNIAREIDKADGKVGAYEVLAKLLSGETVGVFPKIEERYHILEPSPGSRVIYRDKGDKVLEFVRETHVAATVARYCQDKLRNITPFNLDAKCAGAAREYWRLVATPLSPQPVSIAELNQDVYCFHRLLWDLKENEAGCPTFDELFGRIENSNAAQIFIGSLFFDQADRQQYLWLFGEGGEGKGSLARFLHAVFGPAYGIQYPPDGGDKFWTSQLLNKRLVVFPDCDDYRFVTKGLFKSLTGGDMVKVEHKKEQAFTTPLTCKMMFLSNEEPNIQGTKADTRRIIFCDMKPAVFEYSESEYHGMLMAEGAHFLARCKRLYMESNPNHGPIILDSSEGLDRIISENEQKYQNIFDTYVDYSEARINELREKRAPKAEYPSMDPLRLYNHLKDDLKFDHDIKRFLKFMWRKYQIKREQVKEHGKLTWRYVGASFNPTSDTLTLKR